VVSFAAMVLIGGCSVVQEKGRFETLYATHLTMRACPRRGESGIDPATNRLAEARCLPKYQAA
jgi:hypothetical protein